MAKATVKPSELSWEALPLRKRAFLEHLRSRGASELAFKLALAIVHALDFGAYRSIRTHAIAQLAGMSVPELRRAEDELMMVGAIERRRGGFMGRQVNGYRLCWDFGVQEDARSGSEVVLAKDSRGTP
ncbi:hypothetical protein [Trinickia fusca]|uniref:Helix-turn-helix domain-containing protein n=1 Tax=Trinickia fusca TaxID=2419777 RepID=A0A494XFQ5_9BURK|nr:hypothetical protein [Trinickia fusca]RKP46924.1 hypothetical protein D7S89_16375 [Trinickia fusca]